MKHRLFFLFGAVCLCATALFAQDIKVETYDEQLNSNERSVVRLKVTNASETAYSNVSVRYYFSGSPGKEVVFEP